MQNKSFRIIIQLIGYLLLANTLFAYTRQDTLRGSNGRGRDWWDVQKYDLRIKVDTATKTISGSNEILFLVKDKFRDSLQLDLQDSMIIENVHILNWNGGEHFPLKFVKEGSVWWVIGAFDKWHQDGKVELTVKFHGKPRVAKQPPWDGGFIWTRDSTGKPWFSVACQGLGASSWWPCKDYQGDEPDMGMRVDFENREFIMVGNGRPDSLKTCFLNEETQQLYKIETSNTWRVKNPINTYNTTFYIGDYVSWTDTMMGEKGVLDLSFYCLRHNEEKARKHFAMTKDMLHCFEYWMGPYPFYEDGYKLVEAPFLGMEHQSAVAYGNQYKMGYLGKDRSGTGVGDLFDFIIVHESGHEWYGNNITAADMVDNWLHEGFTTYTEGLYAEWIAGREKGFEYIRGEWANIRNDKPIIGDYGVCDHGSGDRYDKGSAVVHMIRMMLGDDKKFRQLLRDMNKDYYHRIVTSDEIEQYIMTKTTLSLKPFFNQYLRTKDIPEFDYYIKKGKLYYRLINIVDGFTLPLEVTDGEITKNIAPNARWQSVDWEKGGYNVSISKDFLVRLKP